MQAQYSKQSKVPQKISRLLDTLEQMPCISETGDLGVKLLARVVNVLLFYFNAYEFRDSVLGKYSVYVPLFKSRSEMWYELNVLASQVKVFWHLVCPKCQLGATPPPGCWIKLGGEILAG